MTDEQRSAFELIARSTTLGHRKVVQAKALLSAADGMETNGVARCCHTSNESVRAWRRRIDAEGVEGAGRSTPGRGRKSWLPEETVAAAVHETLHEVPDHGSTNWTTRLMASRFGISMDTVACIWRDQNLKPWNIDIFEVAGNPHVEERLVDVAGLYLNPPKRAVVFGFDEETQVQALDRNEPSLRMKQVRGTTTIHGYKANGRTDLFAAMSIGTGVVLIDTKKSHNSTDALAFLKYIGLHVPKQLDGNVVLDNLLGHQAPPAANWLADPMRARWHLYFAPTASSWLNLFERWFNELTERRMRRSMFMSLPNLIEAIDIWAEDWNDDPKPLIWHKQAEFIIAKVRRGLAALTQVNSGTEN